jgi:hypothetical protein
MVSSETKRNRSRPRAGSITAARSSSQSLIACRTTCISFPGLMQHGTPFIVAELGADTDPFMLHIYSALVENHLPA